MTINLKEEESLKNDSIIWESTLQLATETMKSRYRYSFSFMDIVYNYLNIFNVLGLCWRSRLKSLNQRHKLYAKGEDKFLEEFDAVSFARTQRKLKMLLNWLMDKSERFLAVYQKTNAIWLSSDSESSSSRHDLYKEVPKLFLNATLLQKHNADIDTLVCIKGTCVKMSPVEKNVTLSKK